MMSVFHCLRGGLRGLGSVLGLGELVPDVCLGDGRAGRLDKRFLGLAERCCHVPEHFALAVSGRQHDQDVQARGLGPSGPRAVWSQFTR
jgi:hypothetical protein